MLGRIVKDISIKVLGILVPTVFMVLRRFVLESRALNRKPSVFSVVNRPIIVAHIRFVGIVLALGVGLRLVKMVVFALLVVRIVSR